LVPVPATQGKLGDFAEHAAGIDEVVDPAEAVQCAIRLGVPAKGFSPIVTGEVDWLRDVVVGAQAAHHKLRKIDLRHGFQQIGEEDDIGILITHM
jgi:hypothetical protein